MRDGRTGGAEWSTMWEGLREGVGVERSSVLGVRSREICGVALVKPIYGIGLD